MIILIQIMLSYLISSNIHTVVKKPIIKLCIIYVKLISNVKHSLSSTVNKSCIDIDKLEL